MSVSSANLGIGRIAERTRRSNAFDNLARVGFAAKGILYFLVGGIAARGAFGTGERPVDQRGAMEQVHHHGLGDVLLWVVGAGLVAFALYKLVEAFADPRKGIARRIGRVGSAAIHGGLAFTAFDLTRGHQAAGGTEHWTARLMAQPFGIWLVGGVGVGVIAFGVHQLVCAYRADIWKNLDTSAMGSRARSFARIAGRTGFAARGVVFGLAGVFLVRAALTANPAESKGLRGALDALRDTALGPWALGVVAVGLMAYAVYCFVRARYFRAAIS